MVKDAHMFLFEKSSTFQARVSFLIFLRHTLCYTTLWREKRMWQSFFMWIQQNPLLALIFLLVLLISLYLIFKIAFQFLRLVAIVGLSVIVGTATWVGLTLVEHALGESWHEYLYYVFVPQLNREVSLVKIFITAFITFSYLLILMRPAKNPS